MRRGERWMARSRAGVLDQLVFGGRLGLLPQLLLQVVVQVFVGVVVRRIGGEVEELDLVRMVGGLRLDLGGMMHLEVVDDQNTLCAASLLRRPRNVMNRSALRPPRTTGSASGCGC